MTNRIKRHSLVFLLVLLNLCSYTSLISQQKSIVVHPEWSKNSVIYEANIRQYTPQGTFKQFEKHLPALKKMGIDIVWLMPINPIGEVNRKGSLGSYYSVKDYNAVNPEYGTLGDFKHLVKQIHKMKMHIIIDWVANHTAWDNVWTKTHPDFFMKDSAGKFISPVADWTDAIDLNYDNKELWDYMIDAMAYWIKECDIDGFRCDVAAMVPVEFWKEAYKELSSIKKVFMLAEAGESTMHQAFDMTYNWPLKDLMNDIAAGKKKASDLIDLFEKEHKEFNADDYRMVFTSNHDENTWNGTEYERLGKGAEAFAVLCGTVKGMPLIYTGQEAGMKKRLRFFDKDTVEWKNNPVRELYTKLNHLKIKNEALWNGETGGEFKFIKTGNENVIAIVREKRMNKVIAVINLSANQQEIKMNSDMLTGNYQDVFRNNKKVKLKDKADFKLGPWEYKVYAK